MVTLHEAGIIQDSALHRDVERTFRELILPLPRIQYGRVLWPPSAKLIEALDAAFADSVDPTSLKLGTLDAPTFEGMWDRVWHTPMLESILRARFA